MPRLAVVMHVPVAFELPQMRRDGVARAYDQGVGQSTVESRDDGFRPRVAPPNGIQNLRLAFLAVRDVVAEQGLGLVDDRPVRGKQPGGVERENSLERCDVRGDVASPVRGNEYRRALLCEVPAKHA